MNKYKPEYLGKVMPVDNPSKLTDFVQNKYDAFSKIYDTCKEQSEGISEISAVDNNSGGSDSLTVKVSASPDSMSKIIEAAANDESVKVNGDQITATGS